MNRDVVFALVIVLAVGSAPFGLIAETVYYREGQGLHFGHIARALTIPLIVIAIMLAKRSGSRNK
jgi:hypothetical protein